jgi:RNA polymerase sigma-70 factor (ECF subfamily)
MQSKAHAEVGADMAGIPPGIPPALSHPAGLEPTPSNQDPSVDDFHRAVYEHQSLLLARALRLTHDKDEAQDLVQDTLVRGMRALHRYEPGTNMRAWLIRIMANLFLDRCRQQAARPALVPLGDEVPEATTLPYEEGEEPPPLSAQVTFDQLHAAMGQLDPIFRRVYELRVAGQKSYEQISAELHIPLGTVGTRLSRARQRLCRLLTPAGQVKR